MRKRVCALMALTAAVVALVPLPASGTGSSGSSGRATGPAVKIGLITPIESASVSNPQDRDVFNAALAYFNEQGGAGRSHNRLEGVVCDTHGDANGEVECARRMVEEGVVATVGDLTFVNPAGVKDVLEAAQIPRVGLSVGNAADFSSSIAFPVSAGPVGEFVADAVGIAAKGGTKVALGLTDSPTAGSLRGLLTDPFDKAGVEIVGETRVTSGATDYSPYVADVQSSGADAVILALAEQPTAQFVAAMEQLNTDVRLSGLTPSFSLDALREHEAITKGSVLVNSLPYPSPNNVKRFPGLKTYFDAMKASGKQDLRPKELNPASLRPWVAMLGFVRATANLDELTKQTVLQALESEQNLDMDGLIPPWTPGTPGYSIFTAVSNPYVYVMTFDGTNVVTKKKPINVAEYFES